MNKLEQLTDVHDWIKSDKNGIAHAVTRYDLPLEHDQVCISSGRAFGLIVITRAGGTEA